MGMLNIMKEHISPEAASILEGMNEALADAKGEVVDGMKKTTVYRVEPKKAHEQLHKSQRDFS